MSRLRKQIKTLDAAANAMRGVHVNHGKETWPRMSVLVADAVEHLGTSNPVRIARYLREEHEPNISTDEADVARVLRDVLGTGSKYGQADVSHRGERDYRALTLEHEDAMRAWLAAAQSGDLAAKDAAWARRMAVRDATNIWNAPRPEARRRSRQSVRPR